MTYRLEFLKDAEYDLLDGRDWYNSQRSGLGFEFVTEIRQRTGELKGNPFQCQLRYKNVRIAYVKRFSHGIHYTLADDLITVEAVWHTSVNPNRWATRIRK